MSLTPQEKAIKQTVRGMELTDWAECIIPLSANKANQRGAFYQRAYALTFIKSLKMARDPFNKFLEIEPSVNFATWKRLCDIAKKAKLGFIRCIFGN